MQIKRANIEDMQTVLKMDEKLNKEISEYNGLFKEELDKEMKTYLKKRFKDKNFYVFLASLDDKPIGFISFSIQKRPFYKVGKIGYIEDLFIEKSYRNKSIGKELFENTVNILKNKNIEYLELHVENKNSIAKEFWRGLGFHEKAVEMRKRI